MLPLLGITCLLLVALLKGGNGGKKGSDSLCQFTLVISSKRLAWEEAVFSEVAVFTGMSS